MTLRIAFMLSLTYQIMIQATRPLVSLFAAEMGASFFEVGLSAAAFAFFPLLFAIKAGKIADRIGDRLPIIGGTIGLTIGMAVPFVYPSICSLYVSQAFVGIAQIFIHVSLQNVVGNTSTNHQRDHHYSLFSLALSIGGLIGPIVGGYVAEQYSFAIAYLSVMLVGALPILLAFFIPTVTEKRETVEADDHNLSSLQLLQIPVLKRALATSALVLYSRDIYVVYFPLYAASLGASPSVIGTIITVQGLAMVLIRLFLSKLTDIFGRDKILRLSITAAGLAFILIPFTNNVYLFGLLAVFMGAGLGSGQPLSMSITYNASPKSRTGEVLGLRLGMSRLAQTIAPFMFGVIGTLGGLSPVFYTSGIFLLGGSLFVRSKTETISSIDETQ